MVIKKVSSALAIVTLSVFVLPLGVMAQTSADVRSEVRLNANNTRVESDTNARASFDIHNLRARIGENVDERRALLKERVDEMKMRTGEKTKEVRADVGAQSGEVRARVAADAKVRIAAHADVLFGKLESALTRLESFEEKIETRIRELSARDIDMTASVAVLADAEAVRIAVAANIRELKADLDTSLESEADRSEIMAFVRAARSELAAVREVYAKVLLQIRADVQAHAVSE